MAKTIQVKVVARSKRSSVETFGNGLKVRLTAAPIDGKANKALIEALAGYFGVKRSSVHIVKGLRSKEKTVLIDI
ncbi:MAG: DUF167 domain-containing protein [Candidatus Omnitrophota bacterium]